MKDISLSLSSQGITEEISMSLAILEIKEKVYNIIFLSFYMIKKIITPQEKERKDKRSKIIIGVILVGLMLLSTAGYALFSGEKSQENKIKYNDITFYKTLSGWTTILNGNQHDFQYLPGEAGSINLQGISISNYYNKPVFLVSDYQDANYELARNLQRYTERINRACLTAENCSEDLPIKTCNDTVIEIREANVTSFLAEDNCVFIASDNPVKAVDAFLYKILGI